ncbi:MAG: hypothetical protein IH800_12415, partial [Myxococcales bacterium]|nr:hypothetical protein [Myxococcales bacterium]
AVAFYNGDAFNRSPAGLVLAGFDPDGVGIKLDATQVVAVAAFLRALNALENIRVSVELLEASAGKNSSGREKRLERAVEETEDAMRVLEGGGLQPGAVAHLERSVQLVEEAGRSFFAVRKLIKSAIRAQEDARAQIVEVTPPSPKEKGR